MAVDTLQFSDLSGHTIKGYELRERIGRGGFGAVYRAYQPAIRREVAVKVILPEYVNNAEFIRRFEAEAQIIAHLEHIHIVPLYDYWRDSDGAFLVMRWLKGGSLRAALSGGIWPLNDTLRLVDQISSALTVAHHNGVIHRDLKPDNILLDDEKNAYLADFGIARDLQNFTQLESLYLNEQQQGQMLGSPHYLSPEQIRSETISPQSDIYSFGIVVYELLTGKTPFEGLPLSTIITKHLSDPLPPLHEVRADLPEALNDVINKATAKDPAERYASVTAFNTEFRHALLSSDANFASDQERGKVDTAELVRLGIITEPLSPGLDAIDPVNPYKGLRPFQEADAHNFYGREAYTNRLVERLKEMPFLAVVGPSGSGKSSAVKAGLIPELRGGALPGSSNWFILEMTPGLHPLEELEAALLRVAVNPPASLLSQLNEDDRGLVRAVKRVLPGGADDTSQLLLFIDQFEEAFTQAENEAERVQFLKILLAAARDPNSRLRTVTTLRADFYDRPLLYPEFGELMRESTEVILPLKRDELEQAIVLPAEKVGLGLETGLVSEILLDVAEQPGSLPLLQYALTELFERRDGRWLTLAAYREIGGVAGALAGRADDLYRSLDENAQHAARQMFLRLVTINEGAEDTRRRIRQDELLQLGADEGAMQSVIDLFGKYRLLTFDRDQETRVPTIEVAHEALIRTWKPLRSWIDDNREGLRVQRRLSGATEEWLNASKDRSYLASGARLDQFEAWSKSTELGLTGDEFEYLAASLAARVEQNAAEEARKAQLAAAHQRSRNFLRALAAVLAIATLGALGLSAFALNQSRIADANAVTATVAEGMALVQADNAATAAAVAQLNADQAHSLAFASGAQLALNSNNTDLAILLAMQANEGGQSTDETRRVLAEAAYAPGTRRVFAGHTERATTVAYSPDGLTAVSGARDDQLIIWDVATGAEIRRLSGHDDWVWDAAYSPDGKYILSASQDGTLILWDVETGGIVHQLEGHTDAVRSVAFNGDGAQAISASVDKTLILWDVETGELVRRIENNSPIFDVAFSKTGFTAVSGGDDGIVTLWNVGTGEPLIRFGADGNGHSSQVWSVAYTPDEFGILSGSDDSTLILWSLETAQPARRFVGHNSRVTSVAVSPDGQTAVSGSEDNSIIEWDMSTAAVLHRFMGHTFLVYGVAYSPDSEHILSASWDTTIRLWDLESGAQVHKYEQPASVFGVDYSPSRTQALTASGNELVLWDTATGEEIRTFEGHTAPIDTISFSPDGTRALSGSDDLSLILWDVETGEIIHRLGGAGSDVGHSDSVWAVAFSPDGQTAVSGSRDNTLIVWDLETGEQLNRLFGHTFHITGVAFSPDGEQIISSAFDNILILWDVAAGEEIRRFEGHLDWIRSVAFSPDGQTILSGSADNTMVLWDVASGKRIRQYEGHTAQVYDVSFSPTGKYAVSGSADATVMLWDVATGEVLRRFTGHTDDVRSVTFSPDEQFILSGSGDATARLWRIALSLDSLSAWIRDNRYLRELTCAERERYNVEPLCATPTPVVGPGSV